MKKKFTTLINSKTFDTSTNSKLVHKIAFLFSTVMFLTIITNGIFNYKKNIGVILNNLQIQLQLAANTIAISIDGDEYEKLKGRESLETTEYRNIRRVLEQFIQFNSQLGFDPDCIYTFREVSSDSLEFVVMLHEQYIGNRYKIRKEMLPTLKKGKSSYTGIYTDENGAWVSAYAPILNRRYQVVGIVEVDYKNNVYLLAVNDEIYSILFFSIAGIILAIISAYLLSRLITKPVINISKAAIRFSEGDIGTMVPVTTGDEIGMLARAFNYMVQEVQEKEIIKTENKELSIAYRKLDTLNNSLKEANRLKSEFLSIAAHDLKSPIQVIMGFSEMILDMPGHNQDFYRNANKIHSASQRMLKLINNLLNTNAIETGTLALNKEIVDIATIAKNVVADNEPLARRKEQLLLLTTDRDCRLLIDDMRVYEIMDNLVNNAIKFSDFGKKVIINVRKLNRYNGRNKKQAVQFEVIDNGAGLTKRDMKNLFKKFNRLSAQPTGGESSTGLGLSVVRTLVELHGGEIWAESKGSGKGACFFVRFYTTQD